MQRAFSAAGSLIFALAFLACEQSVTVFENSGGGSVDDCGDCAVGPCMTANCEDGACVQRTAPDGSECAIGDAEGVCVGGDCQPGCNADACNDGNVCTADDCGPDGNCRFTPMAAAPDDGDPCTLDLCQMGHPTHPPSMPGTPCGQSSPAVDLMCDGFGACVECLAADDCQHLPPTTECANRVCTTGVCGLTYVAFGDPLSSGLQTQGDCHLAVCDGIGGVTLQVYGTDVPNDNDLCTDDDCSGGAPTHTHICPQQQCFNGTCF